MDFVHRNKPFIEIYSLNMMKMFYKKGLIQTNNRDEMYIFSSSYEERINELNEIWTEKNALFFHYQDVICDSNNSFTYDMAKTIKNYINCVNPKIIYLCCDAGESRSAGIAAALYRFFGYTETIIWKSIYVKPNSLCYQRMCEVLGNFNHEDLYTYITLNECMFRKAISNGKNCITREMYRFGMNSRVDDETKQKYFSVLKEINSINRDDKYVNYDSVEMADESIAGFVQDVVEHSLEYKWRVQS